MNIKHLAPFATGLIVGSIFFSLVASAWTAPTLAAPAGNASAPVNLGTAAQVKNGNLAVNALATFGPVVSTLGSDQSNFRMTNNGGTAYGSFLRNDGSNTYLLLTANNDAYGNFNALRPFYVNDATGMVNLDNGLTVRGPGITFPDGTTQTTAAGGKPVDIGSFGPVTSVTVSLAFSSVIVDGGSWVPNGNSTGVTSPAHAAVVNINGVWKYAATYGAGGANWGTLTTGVQACPLNGMPALCFTRTAGGTLTMTTTGNDANGGPKFMYVVYGQ